MSPPSPRTPPGAPAAAEGAATARTSSPVANPAEGAQLIGHVARVMDTLLDLVEKETALVRKGRLRDAAAIATGKSELARAYFADAERLKANAAFLAAHLPRPFDEIRARHETFRARLQMNLTVLATAHAVSEGLIRGVAGEVARKSAPQTYGMSGRANTPPRSSAQPIAVSRTS